MKLRVVLTPLPSGVMATVPGLPGCITSGATEEQALAMVRDAFHLLMDEPLDLRDEPPGTRVVEVEL